MSNAWYTLTVQSNHELKAKEEIERKLMNGDNDFEIEEVFVPIKKVLNIKDGKKRVSEERTYKGYVFIHCDMTDELYVNLKACVKVQSIIGSGGKATKILSRDIEKMKQDVELSNEAPSAVSDFVAGEIVRVTEGPFESFEGEIVEVLDKKNSVVVALTVFGKNTNTDISKTCVEKVS